MGEPGGREREEEDAAGVFELWAGGVGGGLGGHYRRDGLSVGRIALAVGVCRADFCRWADDRGYLLDQEICGPSDEIVGSEEPRVKAKIHVTLKQGILDPQGKAIEHALESLGFAKTRHVRVGKYIELDLAEEDKAKATIEVKAMCEKLLANTIVEDYRFELSA